VWPLPAIIHIVVDTDNNRVQKCPAASHGSDCVTVAATGGWGNGAKQLDSPEEAG